MNKGEDSYRFKGRKNILSTKLWNIYVCVCVDRFWLNHGVGLIRGVHLNWDQSFLANNDS